MFVDVMENDGHVSGNGSLNRRSQLTAADLHGNLVLVCAQVRNREEGRDLVLGRGDLLDT